MPIYHLVASIVHIERGPEIAVDEWFEDPDLATFRAQEVELDITEQPGVMDWSVVISMPEQDHQELLHLCLDDSQPYYEHRGGWRDNYDAARFMAAKKRRERGGD